MTGWVRMARGWRDHPILKGEYSRADAWGWLIETAAFRPTRFDVGGHVITLQRGQLCSSVRQMAEAWGWPKTSVERFLARLKTEAMIGTETGHGRSVITICNYERYQGSTDEAGTQSGTPFGTEVGQHRDTKEEGKKERIEESSNARGEKPQLDATGRLVQPGEHVGELPNDKFGDAAREVVRLAGMARPPRDAGLVKQWMEAGANPVVDIYPLVESMTEKARKRGDPPSSFKFFDKAIRDQVARSAAEVDADIARWRRDTEREEREAREAREQDAADAAHRAAIMAEREALRNQNLATEPHLGVA